MDQGTLFLTILGMWAVTFGVKVGPIALLARRRLPPAVIETIRPLPIAILAALLAPIVLMSEGSLAIEAGNYFIWGAFVAFLVYLASRNLVATGNGRDGRRGLDSPRFRVLNEPLTVFYPGGCRLDRQVWTRSPAIRWPAQPWRDALKSLLIAVAATALFTSGAHAFSEKDLAKLLETNACVGCDLRNADLKAAKLAGADLRKANLRDADLKEADLSGANLAGADLRRTDLEKALLPRANLAGVNAAGADFEKADLSGADLSGADLRNSDMEQANLTGATLAEASLGGADFKRADLTHANLAAVTAEKSNFERAILRNARLDGAMLAWADLDRADMSQASLKEADLSNARIKRANLSGANLEGAILKDAVLRITRLDGANLQGVKGLKQHQLERACGTAATSLPKKMTIPACD